MKQVAVVGRLLNNVKWNALFEILEEARQEEVLEYTSYSVDNSKKYTEIECDAYIYLATKRMFEDDKPWIRFTDKAEGDDFINQITELNEKLFGENKDDDVLLGVDTPSICDSIDDNEPDSNVIMDTPNQPEKEVVHVVIEELISDLAPGFIPSIHEYLATDSPKLKECLEAKSLVGVLIEINGKDVCLHKDDAFKLRELMEFSKEFGFKVKDVITS